MRNSRLSNQNVRNCARFRTYYKFKMHKQLTLLGYGYKNTAVVVELLNLGSLENFYRDSKKVF
ncbi:MAG: type II toxin-antitoxin system RelE/ParE family toxin [Paraglaciecola sp.]|nr:type II toxin-antitoxin system RelE/ParE family toxin [Paraglaciecola sp.]